MCPRSTGETDGIAAKLLRCGIASEALRRNMPLKSRQQAEGLSRDKFKGDEWSQIRCFSFFCGLSQNFVDSPFLLGGGEKNLILGHLGGADSRRKKLQETAEIRIKQKNAEFLQKLLASA